MRASVRSTMLRFLRTGVVVAIAAMVGGRSQANDTIFAFVDEHGEVHLSNVPNDKRYRPIATIPGQGSAQSGGPAADDGDSAAARRAQRARQIRGDTGPPPPDEPNREGK